jgi:hypothetical protein
MVGEIKITTKGKIMKCSELEKIEKKFQKACDELAVADCFHADKKTFNQKHRNFTRWNEKLKIAKEQFERSNYYSRG